MAGRSREYDIAFRLEGIMDPSIRRSIGDSERHIQELERAIRELSSTGSFDSLRRDASRTGTAFDSLQERAESFGDTLNRVAEFTGAKALIDAATGSIQNIVGTIGDQSEAMAQLQASTGMTAEEMREMDTIAKNLYSQPLGEGFDDIASAMATVKQATGQTGEELENTTKNAMVFRDVFAADVPESLKVVDTMMRKFGITSDQAYNLLAQGQQKGLNKADDLMDTINEYSVYFDTMGYSADQMFDTLAAGMENGAFNADKVGDAVKEFGIRIKDGSKSTYAAMATLFAPEGVGKFVDELRKGSTKSAAYLEIVKRTSKTTADSLVKDLNKGGTRAEEAITLIESMLGGGNKIVDDLANGSIKGKDAMEKVITKLKEIKDPIERNQIAVALFGTQFEDLEAETILAMGSARSQFDMTKETMEEVAAVKYDTLMNQFKEIGRGLMVDVVIPIGEDLMPTLQSVADWMADNKELLKVIALGAPAALLTKNTVKIVKSLSSIGSAASGTTGTVGGFSRILGALSNPVGLATTAIGLLVGGVVAYKQHQEDARQELIHFGDQLQEASDQFQETKDKAKLTNDLIWQYEDLGKKIEATATGAGNLAGNSEKLVEQQSKQKEIVKQLQDLHPKTLSDYEVENGKIGEKIGLLKQASDAEVELSRLALERTVAEGEQNLDKTEAEISKLQKQTEAIEARKDAIDSAIPAFQDIAAEFERLSNLDPSDTVTQKMLALVDKANEVGSDVGVNFGGVAHLNMLGDTIDDLSQQRIDSIDSLVTKLDELNTAKQSYEDLYKAQQQIIELDLGGTIDESAAKFKDMSHDQRVEFLEALNSVQKLNSEMDLIPTEKRINVEVLYKEIGRPNPMKPKDPPVTDIVNDLFNRAGFKQYADGGFSDRPAIFGEAGLEAAIPINDKPRSHAILDAVNQMMGHDNVPPAEASEQWRNLHKMQAASMTAAVAGQPELPTMQVPPQPDLPVVLVPQLPDLQMDAPVMPEINLPEMAYPQFDRPAPIQQVDQRNELLTAAAAPQMQQDNSINIEYAPQITIQNGADPGLEDRINSALREGEARFSRMLQEQNRWQRRVNMSGNNI